MALTHSITSVGITMTANSYGARSCRTQFVITVSANSETATRYIHSKVIITSSYIASSPIEAYVGYYSRSAGSTGSSGTKTKTQSFHANTVSSTPQSATIRIYTLVTSSSTQPSLDDSGWTSKYSIGKTFTPLRPGTVYYRLGRDDSAYASYELDEGGSHVVKQYEGENRSYTSGYHTNTIYQSGTIVQSPVGGGRSFYLIPKPNEFYSTAYGETDLTNGVAFGREACQSDPSKVASYKPVKFEQGIYLQEDYELGSAIQSAGWTDLFVDSDV